MKIKRVACVGAGLIGHSWATLFSIKGYHVILVDCHQSFLRSALEGIRSKMGFLIQKGMVREDEAKVALDRIETTTNVDEAVSDADYVQESVFESYETKKTVFKKMDSSAPKHTILASSSSGLLMTEIQKVTRNPERCIIVHPWNPPLLIPLVELVPGEKTSLETIQSTYEFMEKIGKVPVTLKKEVPGYIGNRLQAALWREAMDLVDKGVASVEDVDRAVYAGPGLRWALMGPNMVLHLGGGPRGMEHYINHIGPAYTMWWKSMDTWTSIPYSAAKKVIEEVKRMKIGKAKTFEELTKWRDDKLTELLKILYGKR